jgi:cell division protein FtsL
MNKIKMKIRQLVYRAKKDYFTLGNILLVVALVVCAGWAWASITTMSRNWELEQQLGERRLARAKLELEVQNLKLEQQYYLTAEYQELMARAKGGKVLEGETMVILPENSSSAVNKYADLDGVEPEEKSNFEQWVQFLFG